MNLIKKSFEDIAGSRYSPTKQGWGSAQATVKEFARSDMDVALVVNPNWKNPATGAGVLNTAIKRLRIAGVMAITYKGETYLVKTDKVK